MLSRGRLVLVQQAAAAAVRMEIDLRRPARAEWLARVRSRLPVEVTTDEIVDAIHAGRDER